MPTQSERVVFEAVANMAAFVREIDKADAKIAEFQARASKNVTAKVNIEVDQGAVNKVQADLDRLQRDRTKSIKIPLDLDVSSAQTRERIRRLLEQTQRDTNTSIKIPLVLDEGDFKARVDRALNSAGGSVGVDFAVDEGGFQQRVRAAIERAGGTAQVRLNLDEGDFEERVRRAVGRASDTVQVRMDLDEADFRQRVRAAVGAAGAGESIKVKIEPDFNVGRLRADMEALNGGRIHLSVDADTAAARLELDRLIHEYSGRDIRINANVNRPGIGGIGGGAGGGAGGILGGGGGSGGLGGAASGIMGIVTAAGPMTALILGAGTALGGLAGAATALVAALAPAIAALGISLPFALTGLLGGIGSVMLAFRGMGGALKALSDQQDNAAATSRQQAKTARDNAFANQQAAQQISNAQYALGLSYRQAADQQISSREAVQGAENSLASAQHSAQQAQLDLTAARRDALRTLEDMNNQLKQDALDQRGAQLSLEEAKKNLDATMADPHATELQREQAQLTYDEAKQHLNDINTQTKRNVADTAVANKKGVEGSDQVKNAVYAQQQALQGVTQAQQSLTDALRAQREGAADSAHAIQTAQQALANAQASYMKQIQDQQFAAAEASNKVADALAKLSPSARAFVMQLMALKPVLKDLSNTAGANLFPQLSRGIALLTSPQMLGLLNQMVGESAKVFGDLFEAGAKMISSPAWRGDLATIAHAGAVGFSNLGGAFLKFVDIIRNLMAVAAPFWEAFTKGIQDTIGNWDEMVGKARSSGALADFFKTAFQALHLFNVGMGNLLAVFGHVIQAALPYGMQLLQMFDDWSGRLRNNTKDLKNNKGAQDFFAGSITIFKALAAIIGAILKLVVRVVQSFAGVSDWNRAHGGALTQLWHDIATAISNVVVWIVQHLIVAVEAFAAWYQAHRGEIMAFWQSLSTWISNNTGLLIAIGGVLAGVFVVKKIAGFMGALGKMAGLLSNIGTLLSSLGIGSLGAFAAAAAVVAGLAVTVAAAAKGFSDLYNSSDAFRQQVHQLGDDVSKTWHDIWNVIGPYFKKIWNDLVSWFKKEWPTIIGIVDDIVVLFDIAWKKLGPIIKFVEPIFKDMLKVIGGVLKMIQGVLDIFVGIFTGNWGKVWKGVKEIFGGAWQVIQGTFQGALDKLNLIWQIFWRIFGPVFRGAWTALKDIFSGVLWVMQHAWSLFVDSIKWVWDHIWHPVINTIAGVVGWLWNTIIAPIWRLMGRGWADLGSGLAWVYHHTIEPIWGWMKTGLNDLKSAFDWVVGKISAAWGLLKDALKLPWNNILAPVIEFLAKGVDTVVNWVSGKKPMGFAEKLPRFSTGGEVAGAGDGIRDTVPALLTPGEIVVKKSVAQRHKDELLAMNARGYATGGEVMGGSMTMGGALSGADTAAMINNGSLFNPISSKQAGAGTPGEHGKGGSWYDHIPGAGLVKGAIKGVEHLAEGAFDTGKWLLDQAGHWMRQGAALAFDTSYKVFVRPFLSVAGAAAPFAQQAVGGINAGEKLIYNWIKGKEREDLSYVGDAGPWTGGKLAWPVPGHYGISQHFGSHPGIDIPAPTHTQTVAANTGIVAGVGVEDPNGYGTVLRILGQGVGTLYGHERPEDFKVHIGQQVKAGDPVGGVGSLGNSTGPHLHFEVHRGGFLNGPTDPEPYLRGTVAPDMSMAAGPGGTGSQLSNAQQIANVARALGLGARGTEIGLITALAESGLQNLNYGDRDSLGLFQQRPSQGWGTAAQVTNPTYAAQAFYRVMMGLNWQSGDPGAIAQAVQRSAFPGRYDQMIPQALQIMKQLGIGYATGGPVSSAGATSSAGHPPRVGGSSADTVPAWLQPGEFVVRKRVVDKLGVGFLNALNDGGATQGGVAGAGYATGGVVNPMYSREPNLAYGSRGQAVKDLQYALDILASARLAVDGVFGGGTLGAVDRFQTFFRMPVTGKVDHGMWGFLDLLAYNKTHPSSPIVPHPGATPQPSGLAGAIAGAFANEPLLTGLSRGAGVNDAKTALNLVAGQHLALNGIPDLAMYAATTQLQRFFHEPVTGMFNYPNMWKLMDALEKTKKVGKYDPAYLASISPTKDIDAVIAAQASTNANNSLFGSYIATLAGRGYNYLVQFLTGEDVATAMPVAREAVMSDAKAKSLNAQLQAAASILTGQDLGNASLIAASLQRHPGEGLRESTYDVLLTDQTTVEMSDLVRWYNRGSLLPVFKGLPANNYAKIVSDIKAWNAGVPFASGGTVPGEGDGDTVPAWLTPGEYVVKKKVVQQLGTAFFERLNAGSDGGGVFGAGGAGDLLGKMGLAHIASPRPMAFAAGGPVGDSIYSTGHGDRMLARELHVHNPVREETEASLTKVARNVVMKGVFS